MIKYALILLLSSSFCFSQAKEADKILVQVLYVEIQKSDVNSTFSQPKNIVLFDIAKKKKQYLTNDSFVNYLPLRLPNSNSVLFYSDRSNDTRSRRILGDMAPKRAYLYDLNTNVISLFISQFNELEYQITNLKWSTFSNKFYFSDREQSISSLELRNNKVIKYGQVKAEGYIGSLIPSPKSLDIAFSFISFTFNPFCITQLFNTSNRKYDTLFTSEVYVDVHDWDLPGRKLLFCDSLLKQIDISTKQIYKIGIPGERKKISITDAKYVSNDELILLAGEKNEDGLIISSELYYYSIPDRQLIQLTNDGNDKIELSIFSNNKVAP